MNLMPTAGCIMSVRCLIVSLVVFNSASGAEAEPGTFPKFVPLGHLPGGGNFSIARGVSDDGLVVVGQSIDAAGYAQPVRWTLATGMTPLPAPDGWAGADCLDISGDGSVILGGGITSTDPKNHIAAVYWSSNLQPVSLDALLQPYSMLTGSTPDGSTILGMDRFGFDHDPFFTSSYAFVYETATGVTYLPDLPGGIGFFDDSAPADIDDNGQVIVGFGESNEGIQPVRWVKIDDQWQAQGLGWLPGAGGYRHGVCTAVSRDGAYIVGFCATPLGYEPFMWTGKEAAGQGMVSLGAPLSNDHFAGIPAAVSDDGTVVVGNWSWGLYPSLDTAGLPFIWTSEKGMRFLHTALVDDHGLDLSGWQLTSATGMTPDKRVIIGNGINPSGQQEAWMVILSGPTQTTPGDINGDGTVNVSDLLAVINAWGICPVPPPPCAADIAPAPSGDGEVNVSDLLMVINHWTG